MKIANIKNDYLHNLAITIDENTRKDGNLDISECSQLLSGLTPEEEQGNNYTKEEYNQLVSEHLEELRQEYSTKYANDGGTHFVKCLGTVLGTGLIGGIIGFCKKDSYFSRLSMASDYGAIAASIGIPLYLVISFIKFNNDPDAEKEFQNKENMKEMIFKDFDYLDMSEDERINFLTENCGYAYKNARKAVNRHAYEEEH